MCFFRCWILYLDRNHVIVWNGVDFILPRLLFSLIHLFISSQISTGEKITQISHFRTVKSQTCKIHGSNTLSDERNETNTNRYCIHIISFRYYYRFAIQTFYKILFQCFSMQLKNARNGIGFFVVCLFGATFFFFFFLRKSLRVYSLQFENYFTISNEFYVMMSVNHYRMFCVTNDKSWEIFSQKIKWQ